MVSVQNAAHGSKTHENQVSVGNKSGSGSGLGLWARALGSGSELRALDSGLWGSPLGCGPGAGAGPSPAEAQATTNYLNTVKARTPTARLLFGELYNIIIL